MLNVNELMATPLVAIAGYEVTVGQVIFVPGVLLVGYLVLSALIRWCAATLLKRGVSADVVQIVRRGVFIIGLIVLSITALDMLNVPLTAFAFVSGAVAIGVGFGAQNIINNFISGWILMWERPIRINDFIEVGSVTGTVEQINTRSTRIRRVDGVHMLVPNARLLEETVVNWTLVNRLLRCVIRVGVVYGADVDKVAALLKQVAQEAESVLDDPAVQVIFEDFGDNALIFDLYFWVNTGSDRGARVIRSDIRFAINRLFAAHDIIIAFPQRDIHLDGTLQLESVPPRTQEPREV